MFNVGRYDPRKEPPPRKDGGGEQRSSCASKRKNDRHTISLRSSPSPSVKKRRTDGDSDKQKTVSTQQNDSAKSSLFVIAPEAEAPTSTPRKYSRIEEETFDDLEPAERQPESSAPHKLDDPRLMGTNALAVDEFTAFITSNTSDPTAGEIRNALHVTTLPIREAAESWKLAPFLVENLEREGFGHFFPIQALVIPDIIASERHFYIRAQDICVSAATGQGKTLAFVLPILNALWNRKVKRLRALVVLPSRDLGKSLQFKSFSLHQQALDIISHRMFVSSQPNKCIMSFNHFLLVLIFLLVWRLGNQTLAWSRRP